jgi:hydroxymethylpyrimidine pyrophosphatase-like HAD family hydrolase
VALHTKMETHSKTKKIAEEINARLKPVISDNGSMFWKQVSEEVNHDELVYKLVLKYLRRDGFDIGTVDNRQITVKPN